MASKYNVDYDPYNEIKSVYDAKVGWNNATTDEERQKYNQIATAARDKLKAYGYGDIVDQISADSADATATRKIMEQYAPKTATMAPDSTSLSNSELITTNNNEVRNKNNQMWGTQTSDRQVMAGKYNRLEETAYSNPFTSDEAKAILAKYDLAGLQGRDNAVASGGASNGGNIDSYAAANALRQQASLVNMGQMAVLDAHNNKINNVKGILESLGVYQQNQDVGMQNTIGLQQSESQRLFENDETAKNNEVARLVEQATVTGYTPNEWVIKNDDVYSTYLNSDGTFKKEMEDVDIQALINSAKASGDTETAKKLAVVRAKKMLGNYSKYGQYINEGDVAFMDGMRTEAGNQFDETMKYNREMLAADIAEAAGSGTSSGKAVRISGGSSSSSSSSSKSGSKPSLTAAQARDAIKAGVVNDTTIAAYNYYYGGDYTVDNPPDLGQTNPKSNEPALSEKEVKEWVDYFNDEISSKYPGKVALESTGKNKYERADIDADYIIKRVYESDDLTLEQKEYLLFNKFGISENEVNTARKDPHYN